MARGRPCIRRRAIVRAVVTQLPQQGHCRTETRQCDTTAIHALETLVDAKLTTLRTRVDLQAEKSDAALAASDKAILKAEAAAEKRFESVNEFRLTLSDQTKTFITKVEFESLRETNGARIVDLSSRLDKIEGKSIGLNAGWIYLLGFSSLIGIVASIIAILHN
jgi:hypothetical protein